MGNKNKIVTIISVLILMAIMVFGINRFLDDNEENDKEKGTIGTNETVQTTEEKDTTLVTERDTDESVSKEDSTNENMSPQIEMPEGFVEPGKGALDLDEILGYEPEEKKIAFVLSDTNLVVESVGGYTGNYIEDGSDEPIQNVAAIIITNMSDKTLQVADIKYQVNETETATFWVTNLMPGASVLVMEGSKRTYSTNDDYTYGNVATAWLDSVSLNEDLFEIIKDDGKLTLVNNTDNLYKKVYVYYKYAQTGGAYLGGITYRVPFENVGGRASVESIANHFSKNTSRIIDVQLAE